MTELDNVNNIDSLEAKPPMQLSDRQVELLEKQLAEGTAQEDKKPE